MAKQWTVVVMCLLGVVLAFATARLLGIHPTTMFRKLRD